MKYKTNWFRLFGWIALFFALSVSSCEKDEVPSYGSSYPVLANPTAATTSSTSNYLLEKKQYTVSYNVERLTANWVSWTINKTDLGNSERQNDFRPDTSLPVGWYRVRTSDYTNSGFDRGHLCPSADRTATVEDNSETFLMTNIVPQSPRLNRFVWANLEEYCRELVRSGYFVNVLAGVYGRQGEGSLGRKEVLPAGVVVPERMYKLVIAVPVGSNWTSKDAIHLVADFPNEEAAVQRRDWVLYLTSLDDVERRMGESIRTGLPKEFDKKWHGDWWDWSDSQVAVSTRCKEYNGNTLYIGVEGECFYLTQERSKIRVDKELCNCF